MSVTGTSRRPAAVVVPWTLAALFAVVAAFAVIALARSRRVSRFDSAPVVQSVRKIAKLATVEIVVADVVRYEEVKTFLFLDIPKSATLRIRGRVLGGFDLDRGAAIRADPDRKIVRVVLPRPGIVAIDPHIEWFDEKSGWLNPITPEDRTRWLLWARGELGRSARAAGLEEKAKAHARELIGASAAAFGWKAEITFAGSSGAPSTVPPG
jgi:Protein of unknown function (DUF4230)